MEDVLREWPHWVGDEGVVTWHPVGKERAECSCLASFLLFTWPRIPSVG